MRQIGKKTVAASTALALVLFTSILSQTADAQVASKKSLEKTKVTYADKKRSSKAVKQAGTKNIRIIKNKKAKVQAINYPDFIIKDTKILLPNEVHPGDGVTFPDHFPEMSQEFLPDYLYPMIELPEILDELDAFDYLYEVLNVLKQYDLNKNVLEMESPDDYSFADEESEWYFVYGPEKNGELIPKKYFAVNENGDIFEYNFEKAAWLLLAIPYQLSFS